MSNTPDLLLSDQDNDTSHVSTPVLTHLPASPSCPSFDSTSTPPIESSSSNPVHLRLPVPIPSANLSQTSFIFVDLREDKSGVDFDNLPPEVASADISIAREFLCSNFSLSPLFVSSRGIHRHVIARRASSTLDAFASHNRSTSQCFIRARVPVGTYRAQSPLPLSRPAFPFFGAPILMSKLYPSGLATWVPWKHKKAHPITSRLLPSVLLFFTDVIVASTTQPMARSSRHRPVKPLMS
jgi:hypothetical protein